VTSLAAAAAASPVGSIICHVFDEQQVDIWINRLLQAHVHQGRGGGGQATIPQMDLYGPAMKWCSQNTPLYQQQ
jgi:hypothetical protein